MLGPRFGWCGVALRSMTVPAAFGLAGPVGSPLQRVGCSRRARSAWAGRGVRGTAAATVTAAESRLLLCAASRRVPIPRRTSRLAPDDPSTLCMSHIHGTEADHGSTEQALAPAQARGARRSRPVTGVRSTSETSGVAGRRDPTSTLWSRAHKGNAVLGCHRWKGASSDGSCR
jgi:hypothetical protein